VTLGSSLQCQVPNTPSWVIKSLVPSSLLKLTDSVADAVWRK